jgi:L,D-transpeptidase ErfK/SrfK
VQLAILAMVTVLLACLPLPSATVFAGESANSLIVVNLPSRTLEYYRDGSLLRQYPVAVGSPDTPTPLGTFYITDKEVNPYWYPPGKDYFVPSGPDNPLGYRWLGFLPTYGIHGTNLPWSVGHVVSNGCLRMHEEDVEELFDLVEYGTPVTIMYDRIKIGIDAAGNASLGVYPDIYGYKAVSLADARKQLSDYGLDGLADDLFLSGMLSGQTEQQVVFAHVYNLEINGRPLAEHAVGESDGIYVPVMPAASLLGADLTWNEENRTVAGRQHVVPGKIKGATVYVTLGNLLTLFGGTSLWKDRNRTLSLKIPFLRYEGRLLSCDGQALKSRRYVPALGVAAALGARVVWDKERSELRNGVRRIPVKVIAGEPYIETARLPEYFHAFVEWDEKQQSLDLHYAPSYDDCSMYLDLMSDFTD